MGAERKSLSHEERFYNGGTGGLDLRTMADCTQDTDVCLIVGLLVLGLGIMPLVNGLYGYYVTVPAIEETDDAVKEAAEELGLEDIPIVSTGRLALAFAIMILVGSCMIVVGAALLSIALSRNRRRIEKSP